MTITLPSFLSSTPLSNPLHQLIHHPSQTPLLCTASHPSSHTTLEPSYSRPSPSLPASILSTTLYHTIPSTPTHLPPPIHPNDGDGYILSISFSSSIWLHGRFIRSKPFFVESRAQKRIYRGRHGTRGLGGWNAPIKPKPACAYGIGTWGDKEKKRMIAFGQRALPMIIDGVTLVSKGLTILGDILTDSNELSGERPTEVVEMIEEVVVGVSRGATGKLGAVYVTEIVNRKKKAKVQVGKGMEVASVQVGGEFVVVGLDNIKERGGGLFGKDAEEMVEVDKGELVVVDREMGIGGSVRVGGVVTEVISVMCMEQEVEIVVSRMKKEKKASIPLRVVSDVRNGIFEEERGTELVKIRLRIEKKKDKLEMAIAEESVINCEGFYPVKRVCNGAVWKEERILFMTAFDPNKQLAAMLCMDMVDGTLKKKWTYPRKGYTLCGAVSCPQTQFVSVLAVPKEDQAEQEAMLCILEMEELENGAVAEIVLQKSEFGRIGFCQHAAWTQYEMSWEEDGDKPAKSSYEIFDQRKWNDIDSGFSSLGLRD